MDQSPCHGVVADCGPCRICPEPSRLRGPWRSDGSWATFHSWLLASLLSIPPSKTLLRRHLSTHFKELLGRECIQEKREAEATLGYVPLSATTKVKVTKKSQFTLKRKKSKSELDFGDLVCPLDPNKSGETLPHGDGMTQTEAQHPRAVVVSHESAINSQADQLKSECKFSERTSDV